MPIFETLKHSVMKRFYTLINAIMVASIASLSGQSGVIQFEEARKIEIKLEGEMAHLMENMPKEQRSMKSLYFSPVATLYQKTGGQDVDHAESFGAEGGVRIMMKEPDNKTFVDLQNNRLIEQREFMTRLFLIEDDLDSDEWKISGNQKMILDYPCMEASKSDTAGIITKVWFAPTFPVRGGPSTFCNLPGMVLEVDINDGKQVYLAKSIDMADQDKDLFKRPKDGKKVTREEYDTIVAEKMKEMGGESSAGATVVIKIKN